MALQNRGAERALRGLLGGTNYIALFVGASEVSGGGYTRQSIAVGAWTFANNTASNTSKISFGDPTADWGDVTQIKLFDASTGGNEIANFPLSNDPDSITSNLDEVFIAANAFVITLPLSTT